MLLKLDPPITNTMLLLFAIYAPKAHQIKYACIGEIAVCNAVIHLTITLLLSGDSPSSRSNLKSSTNYCCFWAARVFFVRSPKFVTQFYKIESPLNMRQSVVTIKREFSEIRQGLLINTIIRQIMTETNI